MNSRPTRFEERLKEELLAIAADRSRIEEQTDFTVRSPARRFRMPLALGVAAAAAAGLLVALPVVGDDGGGAPAYALTKSSDGTITVKLFNPGGLPGLERELRTLGVSFTRIPVKPANECSEWPPGGFDEANGLLTSEGDGPLLKINSTTLPAGHTLVFTMHEKGPWRGSFGSLRTSLVPSCIPDIFSWGTDGPLVNPTGTYAPAGGPSGPGAPESLPSEALVKLREAAKR
ncbi:hypothetical protein [Streptomyces sp. KS 21]|uniref:hypothetical protein n=1 Tax=Streptomyces sp. KS 21 TaxID=2485150 RepID=UPI001063DA90|nr:hypothetical protein [Streptomyces sp. KS 21]TDU75653.1 hypothetical protein EDD91_2350 [Streptomyces sp. KS 21]